MSDRRPRTIAVVCCAALASAACGHKASSNPAIDSAFAHAESTYKRGAIDSTEAQFKAQLRAAESRGDSVSIARANAGLALVAYRRNDYAEARRLAERALTMPLRPADRFRAHNVLGLSAYYQSSYREAARFLDQAIEDARRSGDSLDLAKAIMNRGLADVELGDYARARERFRTTRRAVASRDRRTEGKALASLGMLETRVGAPLAAVVWLDTARSIYRADHYGPGEVDALGQLGVAYAAMGEPQRAFAVLDSAITLARVQQLPEEEAASLQLMAEQYQAAGELPRALDYFARAQALNTKLDLQDERGNAIRAEADIHLSLGQLALARQRANDALAVHRTTESAVEQIVDHLLLARIADRSGRPADADSWLRAARDGADRLATPDARGRVALAAAEIADRRRHSRDVLASLDSAALDLAVAAPVAEAQVLTLRARALARLGMLDSAAVVGRGAVRAVERVRSRYAAGALRTSYMAENADAYADLVIVLLRQGGVDEAFRVADAARGRGLLEHLAQAGADLAARPGAAHVLLEAEALLNRIDKLMERLRDHVRPRQQERTVAADGDNAELSAQLQRARNDYEALLERASSGDAPGAALLGARSVGSTTVRGALAPGELLLEYFVAADTLLTFAVSSDTARVIVARVAGTDLATRVRVARELVAGRNTSSGRVTAALESMYRTLIEPVRRAGQLDQATRLVIVPHGPLVYLPFAALRDPNDGKYLVERHAILYAPSAGALVALRGAPSSLDAAASGAVALAPFPDDLPASVLEARGVARAIPGAVVLSGPDATEDALRRGLNEAPLVHVATHGQLNAYSPMFSHVALAAGRQRDRSDDGRLEVHELLGLRVRSSLVFLSGCETGTGNAWATAFSPGEDFTTLAQAFLYAGARSVVATLWPIKDDAAAVFAERFYSSLQHSGAPEALADAQRAMIHDRRYASPFDWAAYTVSGHDARHPVLARVKRDGK
ncbi:MAG TPA: CHAT domain-containing protein [Gemmatimonadaceae bacterium]|nr:CHAT domain-containing protein [Gemmatimonadaceae bacterium]